MASCDSRAIMLSATAISLVRFSQLPGLRPHEDLHVGSLRDASPARLIVLYHSNELNRQCAKVTESNVERRREWQLEHAGVRARRNDLTRLQNFVARREKIREPY